MIGMMKNNLLGFVEEKRLSIEREFDKIEKKIESLKKEISDSIEDTDRKTKTFLNKADR